MNARKKISQAPLDKNLENQQPPDRIAELERQVAELQRDVALLKHLSGWPLFATGNDELKEKKKPGPQKKISDEVLFHYRDGLVLWLEGYWPWLEDRLLAVRTVQEVHAVFEAVAEQPDLRSSGKNACSRTHLFCTNFFAASASGRRRQRPLLFRPSIWIGMIRGAPALPINSPVARLPTLWPVSRISVGAGHSTAAPHSPRELLFP